ncbi:MAG: hypothetical protein HY332_03105 [Chloroflexi bacterium]|nr:hypothetical protein [Chloroflexota bacterium]
MATDVTRRSRGPAFDRPGMMSLEDFLNGPPPPAKQPINWPRLIIGVTLSLAIVVLIVWVSISLQGQADEIWRGSMLIDQRNLQNQ